jgi:phosphoesterase RecJ-like protein
MWQEVVKVKELLNLPRHISILSHRNPDGDALGSTIALALFLQSFGHKISIILPSEYPVYFEWMPLTEEIIIYDISPNQAEECVKKSEVIFMLDFNSLDRIDKLGITVNQSKQTKVMIDHHMDPEPISDFIFSDTSYSSTSEMIFEFIEEFGENIKNTKLIYDCLYTGIMTDTGSFHHNTSARVFKIIATMKEAGLDDTRIQELVLNSQPEKYLKLLGHCLHNRMELVPELKFGLISLTREDYKSFEIQRGDTEGIINYLMMLRNVNVAALVMNQPNIIKLSLRSKGNISVQELCRDHFNGGGHKNASGGASKLGLDETVKKLKDVLPFYIFAN